MKQATKRKPITEYQVKMLDKRDRHGMRSLSFFCTLNFKVAAVDFALLVMSVRLTL